MSRPHYTEHGTRQDGDSLDVLVDEDEVLGRLFNAWASTSPEGRDRASAVTAKWDHGTVGKLLLEHSAVWLAAGQDVARVLEAAGADRTAGALRQRTVEIRPHIDRMAECSHGVQPINLAIAPEFTGAVEGLRDCFTSDFAADEGAVSIETLKSKIGEQRGSLRSAKYIRKHAPSHPHRPRWYDHLPFVVRIRSAFDRLRGFPWGESGLGDRELAEEYDREG